MSEYPPKTIEYTEKQKAEVLAEVDAIMENFEKEPNSDLHEEKKDQIITFIKDIEGAGFSAHDYILGQRLNGSMPDKTATKFDTPDHDIEKFIRSFE